MPRSIKIILLSTLVLLAIGAIAVYFTFYSPPSKAAFLECTEKRICINDNQCGGSLLGRCDRTTTDTLNINNGIARRVGKCVCVKPTVNPTTAPVTTKWWYNDLSKESFIECKKGQFSGAYMTQGLKTFNTLKECEVSLFGNKPDIAKVTCDNRKGKKIISATNNQETNQGVVGYHWSFNIDKSTSCWTPDFTCQSCNGKCVDTKTTKKCPVVQTQLGQTEAFLPEKNKLCEDIHGRCVEVEKNPNICPQNMPPPPGCRTFIINKQNNTNECPEYKVVCDISPTALPSSTPTGMIFCPQDIKTCPNGSMVNRIGPNCEFAPCPIFTPIPNLTPNPSIMPTAYMYNPVSKYCVDNRGTWRKVTTETGEEGWCMKGNKACEEWAFFRGECKF